MKQQRDSSSFNDLWVMMMATVEHMRMLFYPLRLNLRRVVVLGLVLAVSGGLCSTRAWAAPPAKPGYNFYIGGFYHGAATGSITGHHLDISGTVETDDGTSGTISASHLQIKGSYFSGTGTVCGHGVTFEGRFDQAATKPAPGHVGSGRIVITFSVDDGHKGRIVGIEN